MRLSVYRLAGLLLIASLLGACDKCADNYLVDPFAKPSSCHGEPAIK